MDHDLTKVSLATEKLIANPQKILVALLRQWNPRPHSGMA